MILRHCVIKWRHMVNILTDLESTHQGFSYEVLHDIFLRFQNLISGYTIFDLGAYHIYIKVTADQPSKHIS
jgi:hypothetical protein